MYIKAEKKIFSRVPVKTRGTILTYFLKGNVDYMEFIEVIINVNISNMIILLLYVDITKGQKFNWGKVEAILLFNEVITFLWTRYLKSQQFFGGWGRFGAKKTEKKIKFFSWKYVKWRPKAKCCIIRVLLKGLSWCLLKCQNSKKMI